MSSGSVRMRLIYVVFTQMTYNPKEVGIFRDHQDAYLNGVLVRGGLRCFGVLVRGELVCSGVSLQEGLGRLG
ncbi:hypothetical protein ACE6H2_015676 [Prunus campanulata]